MYTMKMYAIIAQQGMYEEHQEWVMFLSADKAATLDKAEELREYDERYIDSDVFYSVMEYTLDGTGMVTETHCI